VVVGYAGSVRIFVDPALLAAGELRVTGDEHHYLGRVRRARIGDAVEIVDGAGRRAHAVIERITDRDTTLRVGEPEAIIAKPPLVRVLVPLIKGDRMDGCLEKLVEVGADAITVWPAARSVVKLDAKRDARIAKYQALLQAAARQCGRAQIPSVSYADSLAAAVAALPEGARLVLDPASDAPLVVDATDVTIASGPEGGLAPDELELLARAGFVSIGLGPRILRAETAPTIAVALIRATTAS
jgi:16S rRNA (uracil1498-N3)-methyltransferase